MDGSDKSDDEKDQYRSTQIADNNSGDDQIDSSGIIGGHHKHI